MKINSLLLVSTFLSLPLFFDSCSKEQDPKPTTSSDPNAKFLGNWIVTENSKLYGPSTYNLTISDSTNNTYILFAYLYGFKTKIKATTSNSNIVIPSQIIEGNSVSGTGLSVSDKQINLTYYVNSGLNKDTVSSVLKK